MFHYQLFVDICYVQLIFPYQLQKDISKKENEAAKKIHIALSWSNDNVTNVFFQILIIIQLYENGILTQFTNERCLPTEDSPQHDKDCYSLGIPLNVQLSCII